jgi:hypothetical protein
MKVKPILKEILLSPVMGALIVPMAFLVVLQLGWESFRRPYSVRGKAYESWETANGTFKMRATAYHESGVYLPGAYLAFESAPIGSNEWNEFAVFHVGDAIPIPRDRLNFVSEQAAYFFMADGYVATVDGGRTWYRWEPKLPLPSGQLVNWAIKDLHVEPDGAGAARLRRYDEQVKEFVYLDVSTKDFGRHWDVV